MNKFQLVLLTAACFPASLIAQQIEEIVVRSSALAKSESEIVGALNIIDSNTLKREAASTLGGTLHNQIGVASGSFGPGVGVPVIRGQSGKRVEILQNNSSVGDVSDISADHAVATEALLADRIEILRGPATLRYGPGAIGGVVNIIDYRIHKDPIEGLEGAAEFRYDNNSNNRVLVGRADLGIENWVIHVDGLTRNSDNVEIPGLANTEVDDPDETTRGYIGNTGTDAESYSLGLSWIGNGVSAGLSFNQLDNLYGIPPGAHAHHHHEGEEEEAGHEEEEEALVRLDMEQSVWQASLGLENLPGMWGGLEFTLNQSDYQHVELEIEDGVSEVGTQFANESSSFGAELSHEPLESLLGVLGFHWKKDNFEAVGEEAFVPPSETSTRALYLVEEMPLGGSTLELGARWDQQRISSAGIPDFKEDIYNLSGALLVPVGENSRIGFIASRAQRAPVAQELISDGVHVATGAYEIGDATLKPETSTNLEISFAIEGDLNLRVTLYQNLFADYIYQQDTELLFNHDLADGGASGIAACTVEAGFDDPEEAEEAQECFLYAQENARFFGFEAESEFAVGENQSLRFWGDLVHARFDSDSDVPRQPPARVGLSWNYQSESWSGQLSLLHALNQNRPGEGQESTEGYVRIDGFMNYSWGVTDIFLRGTNLTNEEIRNSTSFLREVAPEPGRSITLGATYNF